MLDIRVEDLGLNTHHEPGFVIDRPDGLGLYLLQRFHTPMELHVEGRVVRAAPDDWIIYEPACPQLYRGRDEALRDDWLHLDGEDLPETLAEMSLPLNRPIRAASPVPIKPILACIQAEFHGRELYWQRRCGALVLELLVLLARQVRPETPPRVSAAARCHIEAFRALRRTVLQSPAQEWTVAAMARRVHLSPSRFGALYREFFGVSPVEDLLRRRIVEARRLLSNTAMPVARAAALSGFANVYYFSRQFRRRVGCPPRDYYRRVAAARGLTQQAPRRVHADDVLKTPDEAAR
jgi:AraC-like DNA-binding protein